MRNFDTIRYRGEYRLSRGRYKGILREGPRKQSLEARIEAVGSPLIISP